MLGMCGLVMRLVMVHRLVERLRFRSAACSGRSMRCRRQWSVWCYGFCDMRVRLVGLISGAESRQMHRIGGIRMTLNVLLFIGNSSTHNVG